MSKKALNVQDDSRCKGIEGNTSKSEIKCVCLNARSIINKKTELNIMVDDIKPHTIGITESWANNDITNAELGLEGYVMFRKDRIGRKGGGVLLYIKDTIPAYEVQLQEKADCNKRGLDSAIDSFVPMKKQGKRSKKKHLSKEAFRKIRHKQNMWRVYKHTGKDQDYVVYKEALYAATNEVRKSKRNFELKLAQNIKSDSKSFYAYVRSRQNVRDKVGPLEDNAGDKITEGISMAEELNYALQFSVHEGRY